MVLVVLAIVVCMFGFVVAVGAPYLPTRRQQIIIALEMLEAGEGKVLVDLGSGDGVFLKAAAAKGAEVYGYELNPILCIVSWLRCVRYRKQVHIKWANFWNVELPTNTTGVYVFLLRKYMKRFDQKMEAETVRLRHGFKLASFTFAIPHKKVDEVRHGVFLYRYPAEKH